MLEVCLVAPGSAPVSRLCLLFSPNSRVTHPRPPLRARKSHSKGRSLMYLNRSFLKGPAKIVGTFLGSLVLLLVFGVTTHAQSNVYTKWTAMYRPGQFPLAIVADGQGNTHLTRSVVVCFPNS